MVLDPVEMGWDVEWLELIYEAREIGLTLEEVREYLGIKVASE